MSNGTMAAIILSIVFLSMAIGGALGTIAAGNGAAVSTVTESASPTSTNSTGPYILPW